MTITDEELTQAFKKFKQFHKKQNQGLYDLALITKTFKNNPRLMDMKECSYKMLELRTVNVK